MHLGAVAGFAGQPVAPTLDDNRVAKVLVKVVHVLDHPPIQAAADGDVVEWREVLDVLTQAYAARMWADRHAEPGGQEQDRNDLVDAAQPARIDLADRDRLSLEQLLEHDSVVDVLPRGDPDRGD